MVTPVQIVFHPVEIVHSAGHELIAGPDAGFSDADGAQMMGVQGFRFRSPARRIIGNYTGFGAFTGLDQQEEADEIKKFR